MKISVIVVNLLLLSAVASFSADQVLQPKVPGPNFEQHKADILKRIDERIARNQEEKTCIQAARSHDDIRACRDRFKAEVLQQRQDMKK